VGRNADVYARKAGQVFGDTPLCAAAFNGHSGVVKRLVEQGANINLQVGWVFTSVLDMPVRCCLVVQLSLAYYAFDMLARRDQTAPIRCTGQLRRVIWHVWRNCCDLIIIP